MKHLREENKIVVCDMPKEGIKNATNTESPVLDKANRRRRVSRRNKKRKVSVSTTNEKDRPKTRRISLVGPSTVYLKKKLIVLDVNGLLVDIVSPPPKHRKADATVGKKACEKQLCYYTFSILRWCALCILYQSSYASFQYSRGPFISTF